MKKAAVFISIFLFLGNSIAFAQDGEEIDFLEKVAEPKKTVSKKSSSGSSSASSTKSSKKKEKKKSKKKKKKSSSSTPSNPEGTKKNVEPNNGEEGSNSSSNSSQNGSNGQNNSSSNSSNNGSQTSSRNLEEQQVASASNVDTGNLPKPYWVNEEMKIRPNNLPGYTASAEPSQNEQGPSFQNRLADILKLGEDKKKEEEKKKVQEGQKSGSFTGFISEYKKPIIIVVFILLFALYRLKAGKSRGSSSRRSPVTINKMRRD
ncbi:SRP-less Sec system protein [Leptospira sp. FAT2]|uniref:SRP-less Sec system protein n=1 Tax=Leptospira sanjuanensis TaxID=2879643 RepID=UPI001EE8D7FF|nr:SRP-less Sec system protein [Leptospira sanjuanensis]MCG6167463.1 SRP-less Sec system protein [Leptospira sanjuanensis]MCG6192890.1 SRP-less Sec system protein [Leptospira sanjuanensis]